MSVTTSPVDLTRIPGDGGVVWSCSPGGFHANLVVLASGHSVASHRNDSLDVLIVVVEGTAEVTIDGASHEIEAGGALVVPQGSTRTIAAGDHAPVRYLTVHGERSALTVGRNV
jgi:quercetin dioxygenase-like cupin family protein